MKIFFSFVIGAIAILILVSFVYRGKQRVSEIHINTIPIRVEVMDTMAKRARGLSGREPLGENEGMLFIFDERGMHPFWMKGMKFSIDIIWISQNTIIGFVENAELPSGLHIPTYTPPSAVDKVLEMNAGSVQKLGMKVGDVIQ